MQFLVFFWSFTTHICLIAHDGSTLSAQRDTPKSVCAGLGGLLAPSTPGSIPRHWLESCFSQQRSSPLLASISSNLYSTQLISTNSRIAVPEECAFKQPIQPAVQRVQPAYCRLSAKMRRSSSWLANLLRPREERRSGISLGLFGGEVSERTLSFSLQIIFFPPVHL